MVLTSGFLYTMAWTGDMLFRILKRRKKSLGKQQTLMVGIKTLGAKIGSHRIGAVGTGLSLAADN